MDYTQKVCRKSLQLFMKHEHQINQLTNCHTGTFTGPIHVEAHLKFRRKWSVGVSRDCPIFWVPPVISETGKATDFKFGGYIYSAYPNKSPLKILEKRQRARIQGLPKIFGFPLLSQERVKLRTSNFVGTFIGLIGTKAHENVGHSVVGVGKESRKFSGHPYVGRIARPSLR